MIKIKYLFLLVLCLGTFGWNTDIYAQGPDAVASAGGKILTGAEVNGLIKFYEWALGAEFTGPQRERYRAIKIEEFRNDPAAAKKGIDELIGYLPQIHAKSKSEQAKMREAFNAGFIPDLRKANADAEAQFLLAIYDGVRVGNHENTASDGAGDASELAGKWVWARTGSTTWNSATGAYAGGNGSRFTYEFSPSGAVEYTGIMNVMMGGCSQQVFMSKKGRARLSGDSLTIKWSSGTSARDFSCDRANNYTKSLPADTETLKVSFKTDSTGRKLFCTGGREETCFSPAS